MFRNQGKPVGVCHISSFKLARVEVFPPWKTVKATNPKEMTLKVFYCLSTESSWGIPAVCISTRAYNWLLRACAL